MSPKGDMREMRPRTDTREAIRNLVRAVNRMAEANQLLRLDVQSLRLEMLRMKRESDNVLRFGSLAQEDHR